MGKGLWAPGTHCILTEVTFKKGLITLLFKKIKTVTVQMFSLFFCSFHHFFSSFILLFICHTGFELLPWVWFNGLAHHPDVWFSKSMLGISRNNWNISILLTTAGNWHLNSLWKFMKQFRMSLLVIARDQTSNPSVPIQTGLKNATWKVKHVRSA